jgi:citrate synthase
LTDTDKIEIETGLGWAERDRVLVRGRDLNSELLGNITFTGMLSLLLRGRLSSPAETRMLDALLVILVEHGMVKHVVSARFVYANAPESIQGAVCAALLGAGSKHLGSSEWCAQMLQDAVSRGADDAAIEAAARRIVDEYARRRKYISGIGHSTHTQGDPRAMRLFEIARETGVYGTYCRLIERISVISSESRGRLLPVNVTGAQAAITSDMGFRWEMAKSFALIGRTLGALGHIQEELDNPMADKMNALIHQHLKYTAPEPVASGAPPGP